MLIGLLNIHSILRYILLLLMVISIVKAYRGWAGKLPYSGGDRKLTLFTVISAHLQLVIGFMLYFMGTAADGFKDMGATMKDATARFWTVEHMSMMLIAIILITIGSARAKRAATDEGKHKQIVIFFLLALAVIFVAIPWPWKEIARPLLPGMTVTN